MPLYGVDKIFQWRLDLQVVLYWNCTVHLANTIAIIQGKSLNFGQSDYPRTLWDSIISSPEPKAYKVSLKYRRRTSYIVRPHF